MKLQKHLVKYPQLAVKANGHEKICEYRKPLML